MSEGALGDRLSAAVGRGDADAVRGLLECGADPNTAFVDGLSVMCAAISAFDTEVVSALVEGGADPCLVQPDGSTPLERAVDSRLPGDCHGVVV